MVPTRMSGLNNAMRLVTGLVRSKFGQEFGPAEQSPHSLLTCIRKRIATFTFEQAQ